MAPVDFTTYTDSELEQAIVDLEVMMGMQVVDKAWLHRAYDAALIEHERRAAVAA